MLEEYHNELQHLVLKHEQWKIGVKQRITKKNKFQNLFSKGEQEYIQRSLHDINNLLKHRISAPSF